MPEFPDPALFILFAYKIKNTLRVKLCLNCSSIRPICLMKVTIEGHLVAQSVELWTLGLDPGGDLCHGIKTHIGLLA